MLFQKQKTNSVTILSIFIKASDPEKLIGREPAVWKETAGSPLLTLSKLMKLMVKIGQHFK